MRKVVSVVVALAIAVAIVVGVLTAATPVEAKGPCICPLVYAPVECDHGKIYPNQCVADCRHAKNCVPIGIL